MLPQQKQQLVDLFTRSLAALGVSDAPVLLERPKVEAHGDVACNVALQVARRLGRNPREFAPQLAGDLQAQPEARALIDAVEIAGPGFINLRIAPAATQAIARIVLHERESFGTSRAHAG